MKTLKKSDLQYLEHLDLAHKQRKDYQQRRIQSKKALREIVDLSLNNHPFGINSLKANVTFSFDLARMVHYPNNSDQVVCFYFKVPRKCSLFGVANEGLGTQVTYPIDEIVDCGK